MRDRILMNNVPTILPDDTARARRSDPLTSHEAADASALERELVKTSVYHLIDAAGVNGLTGSEVNTAYPLTPGARRVAWDTPRKRIADLRNDGFLCSTGFTRKGINGTSETVWVSKRVAASLLVGIFDE